MTYLLKKIFYSNICKFLVFEYFENFTGADKWNDFYLIWKTIDHTKPLTLKQNRSGVMVEWEWGRTGGWGGGGVGKGDNGLSLPKLFQYIFSRRQQRYHVNMSPKVAIWSVTIICFTRAWLT